MEFLSGIILLWLVDECSANKKYCWYFEGGYPIYFIFRNISHLLDIHPIRPRCVSHTLWKLVDPCRSYEDCCGTRCCVRALSIQRLWYFWLLLMLGVVFCCGAGFFLRRRMYATPLPDEPDSFNVHYTRQPITTSDLQLNGLQNYGDPGGGVSPAYPPQLHPSPAVPAYPGLPPLPAYCSLPPPPYEQVLHETQKK